MSLIDKLLNGLLLTVWDVLPIAIIVLGFQLLVIRRTIPNLKRVLVGFVYVLLGLTLFIKRLRGRLISPRSVDG